MAEGLVVARRPSGYYVVRHEHVMYRPQSESRPMPATPEMDRFMQQIADDGRAPSQVIDVSIVAASDSVAEHLRIEQGEDVALRRRTRYINGEPTNINDSYYPLPLVRDSEIMSPADVAKGTNQALADLGYPQTHAIDELTARMSTPAESARLDIGTSPVVVHLCTGYAAGSRPIRHTVNVLPGDRYMVVYERSWDRTDVGR